VLWELNPYLNIMKKFKQNKLRLKCVYLTTHRPTYWN